MRYPKQIKPQQELDEIVLNVDFAPTLLDFAGLQIPKSMQGYSMKNLVYGRQKTKWRESMYYHYFEFPHGWHFVKKHYGIRTDRLKLIQFYDDIDGWEFYDLKNDKNPKFPKVNREPPGTTGGPPRPPEPPIFKNPKIPNSPKFKIHPKSNQNQ